jgi:hydrogenase-4 component E
MFPDLQPAPGYYVAGADAVAVIVLLLEFGMLRQTLLRDQIRLYALQSLLVTVLAVIVAVARGIPELYGVAAASLVLKVILIPGAVLWLLRTDKAAIAGSARLGIASEVLLAIAVAVFGFFVTGSFDFHSAVLPETAFALAVAIFLVGFVLMIERSDVVSQAIGFFSLENGVSIASLVVAAGLPLIIEVAFLLDLLLAVVVFGVLMRVHRRQQSTLSTDTLTRLRG